MDQYLTKVQTIEPELAQCLVIASQISDRIVSKYIFFVAYISHKLFYIIENATMITYLINA